MQIQELLPTTALTTPLKPARLDGIDLLRGLVIVLMALDHTKDFFLKSGYLGDSNPAATPLALFFTRWVTHYCAPTFVFLAGVGAFLSHRQGDPKERLAGYLCLRGLLLVFLELTVVKFGWSWHWPLQGGTMLQVIWAIGWSMILLSFLVWLPSWFVGLIGVGIIFGHNQFDGFNGLKLLQVDWGLAQFCGVKADWQDFFGDKGWLWDLLFVSGRAFAPGKSVFFNLYPIIPWFGVLAAGYGLGAIFRWEPKDRRTLLGFLGVLLIGLFLVIRYQNGYGDPRHWQSQKEELRTVLSFINCTKYPPSLCYLLMTLGPALICLACFDYLMEVLRWPSSPEQSNGNMARYPKAFLRGVSGFFLVFGKVPLCFYLLHLPLIHWLAKRTADYLGQKPSPFSMGPLSKGFELPTVYGVWVCVLLLLFLPCLGYGWLKKRYGGFLKLL